MEVEVDADMVKEKLAEAEEEEAEDNSSDKIIKSNNPHLAGGEKNIFSENNRVFFITEEKTGFLEKDLQICGFLMR